MPDILNICVLYFFITVILFTVSYFAGHSIFKISKTNLFNGLYLNLFIKTLIGTCFIITLISLVYSSGKTINLIFILLGIFMFIESRFFNKNIAKSVDFKPKKIFTVKNIMALLLLIILVFLWQARILIKIDSQFITGIEPDNYYYAEISKCLISTGQENTFTSANLVNAEYHFPTPYHYFDLWFNGFVAKIFNLNYVLSLYLITYTFFTCLFLFGILACFEKYSSVNYKHKIISFLLLFTGGLYISEKILKLSDCAQMETLVQHYGEKLAPVYCLTLLLLILSLQLDKSRLAFILALCLPVVSISLAPAVFGGISIYACLKLLSKEKEKLFYLRLLIYTILTSLIFSVFYFLFKKNGLNFRFEKPLMSYSDLRGFTFFDVKFYLVELFLKCYYHPLLFILNYFPFIILMIFAFVKLNFDFKTKSIIILFSLFLFCGLIAYNTFYLLDDAYQLYIHAIAVWHVLFAYAFIFAFNASSKIKTCLKTIVFTIFVIALILKMILTFFSEQKSGYKELKFSQKYLNEVNLLCNKLKSDTKGAIIYGAEFYNNNTSTLPLEYYYFPFVFSENIYVPFNLTALQTVSKANVYQTEKLLSKSPFNLYLNSFSNENDSNKIQNQQMQFIKINKLKYIICSENQNIDFQKYFEIESEIIDSISGQKFLILK